MGEDPIVTLENNTGGPTPVETRAPPGKTRRRFWPWQRGSTSSKVQRRPLLRRLFSLSFWGMFCLGATCSLVGFAMLAVQYDPASPGFSPANAAGTLWRNLIIALEWTVTRPWTAPLTGASLVLPVWILWRLISVPFRR